MPKLYYNLSVRFLILLALLLLFCPPSYALRLDISADFDISARSYSKLTYSGSKYKAAAIATENTKLGVYVSDLKAKASGISLDMCVLLQSIEGLSAEKMKNIPLLTQPQESYPALNSEPYLRQAYIKMTPPSALGISIIFGRQDFCLGQGIALASDNMGMTGLHFSMDKLFWGYGLELFYFNPSSFALNFSADNILDKAERKYHVYGAAINNRNIDGKWQLYHFFQHYSPSDTSAMAASFESQTKTFSGIHYAMDKGQIAFDGELSVQGGSAKAGGADINYSGYAFMLKGAWEQGIYIFDSVNLRLGYGRSSAGYTLPAEEQHTFYPAFGQRYDGFFRKGYGSIAAASLYDMYKFSDTKTGLPAGLSGLSIVNAGVDIPYKGFVLSADYYKFKAHAAAHMIDIAAEFDFKLEYSFGAIDIAALCAYLKPAEGIEQGINKSISLAALSVKAGF